MSRKTDCWGIEVGANALKAVRLVKSGANVTVADYAVIPFKQILTTPDIDVDEAVQVGLTELVNKHDVSSARSGVVVSVPGHLAFARFAKLPPVEPKQIKSIVEFEAKQQIPFPIEQVEWDYQIFQQEDLPDVEVGIFAITKERVARFLNNYRRVDIGVDQLTLSPLAVYNAFYHDHEGQDDGVIYMDIGTSSTDVIIVENGGVWLRTLPIGGNSFTESLVKQFKISFPRAEKEKLRAGTSKHSRQIFQAMRPVFADLVQEVQRSLGYYQSMNRQSQLKRLVGVGSTFRLPGLQKFLKQQLQLEVIRPDGFERIAVEGKREADFAEHALNLATAYGLALQGLGMARVQANVLPSAILRQRMWRSKQKWFAAAAAVLVAGVGAAVARYFADNAAYDAAARQADAGVRQVMVEADQYASQWREIDAGDPRLRVENLRRILDYRTLWPQLLADIAAAAASGEPQDATYDANKYEQLKQIPRKQRKRIYIDSVHADYLVGNQSADQSFSQPDAEVQAAGGGIETYFNQGAQPPRFKITVTGTTPHGVAATFLDESFIGWLRRNADRPDRPYTIELQARPIISLGVVGSAGGARNGAAATPRGNQYGQPRQPRNIGGYGRPAQRGYGAVDDFGGAQTYARPGGNAGELIPPRPTADESAAEDSRFVIEFVVKLRSPQVTRTIEDTGGPPPPQVDTDTDTDTEAQPVDQQPADQQPAEPQPEQAMTPSDDDGQEAPL